MLEDVPYGKRNLPDFQQVLQSHLNACPKDSDFRVEKNSIYCRDCVQRVACSVSLTCGLFGLHFNFDSLQRWEALHDLSKYSQHCQTAGHIDYRESSRGNLISPVAALSPSLPTKRASTSNSTSFSHLPRASLSSSQTKPEPLSDDDVVITSVTTRPAASQRKRRSPQMTSENNDDDDVSFVSYKKPRTSTSSSATSRRTTPAVKKGKPLSVLEWLKPSLLLCQRMRAVADHTLDRDRRQPWCHPTLWLPQLSR